MSNVHWWIIGYFAVLLVYLGVQLYVSGWWRQR